MFVNGTQVCERTGAVLTEGQMGLAAGWAAADGVSLAFDGYKVCSAPRSHDHSALSEERTAMSKLFELSLSVD